MPQAVAVPASVESIDRLTLAVDAVRATDAAVMCCILTTCFADDSE